MFKGCVRHAFKGKELKHVLVEYGAYVYVCISLGGINPLWLIIQIFLNLHNDFPTQINCHIISILGPSNLPCIIGYNYI